MSDSRSRTTDASPATASHRSSGKSASVRERPASSSNTSIALRQAAACEGVDLAQIQHVPLHHSAIIETPVLDDVPVAVRLAVFLSLVSPQKHDAANLCTSSRVWESGRSTLQPFSAKTESASLCKSIT